MSASSRPNDATGRLLTAITVMRDGVTYMMCPFFGKCDGFLIIDPVAAQVKFLGNPERTAIAMCRAIVSSGATRLICGFVPEAECKSLRAAGIDVRLGSCSREVDELVTEFARLPEA